MHRRIAAGLPLLPLIALLLLAPVLAGATTVPPPEPRFEVLRAGPEGMTLLIEIPPLRIETLRDGDRETSVASFAGASFEGGPGAPAVPALRRLIALPVGASATVRAERMDEETIENVTLAAIPEEEGDRIVELRKSGWGSPGANAVLGGAASIHGFPVAPLLLRPVLYDGEARTLRIARRMRVEIDFAPSAAAKTTSPAPPVPPSIDRLLRSVVLGYGTAAAEREVRAGAHLVIAPDDPAVLDSLQPWLDWRARKGAGVILSVVGAGATAAAVKETIQSVYDDPSSTLEYVTLVGDAGYSDYVIPTWYENLSGYHGEGDHPYTQLDGDDVLPDVHIGRLSFVSMNDLSIIVNKILDYETAPWIDDPEWFSHGLVVGDPTYSGWSVVDVGRWLTRHLVEIGYTEIDTVWSGNFVSQIRNSINGGASVFGYRGFGGMSGWSNGVTYTLSNGWKMPFVVALTCQTGSFADGTSISEGFLRFGTASPFTPRGGIGAIGTATPGTHTRYNNCMFTGIWRGFTRDGQHTMGASLSRGKLELFLNYDPAEPNIPVIWSHWNNLMGDPSVDVWTARPESLSVDAPARAGVGANAVAVVVTRGGGGPVEGAQVCVWKGEETHAVAWTDAEGRAELPVAFATTGEALLTVSGHNLLPSLGSIAVIDTLHIASVEAVVGDAGGDADSRLDPGETPSLLVRLHNYGAASAGGVTAILSTEDPFLSIDDAERAYGDIPGGGDAWGAGGFDLSVDPGCPSGRTFRFALDVTSDGGGPWRSLFELTVDGAEFIAQSHAFDDGADGRLDPGETAEMIVTLHNPGEEGATGVSASLRSLAAGISVIDGDALFGDIPSEGGGDNDEDRFSIHADPSLHNGASAMLALDLLFSGGLRDTVFFPVTVGERNTSDPVGPDGYGYLAYDDTDTGYPDAPIAGWIEIDPSYGGDGEQLYINDFDDYQDAVKLVDLPFTFRYYGEEYDQVSVCSNGWLSMGYTPQWTYRNWTIPSAMGPDAMLAVFWDDLYRFVDSGIFVKHDEANHRWIVEWSRMRKDYGASLETFEAVLYDPAWHATETGDGPIEFRYQTITNYDPIDNHATVGIENRDQTDGVLITYARWYREGAATVTGGRAIRFVPKDAGAISTGVTGGAPSSAGFGIAACRPNPFNPRTAISWSMEAAGPAALDVYDVSGRLVRTLFRGEAAEGTYESVWDGRTGTGAEAGSGIYFLRLRAGDRIDRARITLVR
ncbi:MAG: T9SS type A sorting domain-containing protein [Candidatus Eisenbacteria bacterium]|nr:T9SS type A sorting domain-containing protein [Candidatus Eisenbacteria bacterium]